MEQRMVVGLGMLVGLLAAVSPVGLAAPSGGGGAATAPPTCAGLVIRDEAGHEVRHAALRQSPAGEPSPFVEPPCAAGEETWLAGNDYEILALCVARGDGGAPVARRLVLRTLLEKGGAPDGTGSLPGRVVTNWWTGEADLDPKGAAVAPAGCTAVKATVALRERAVPASFAGLLGPRTVTVEGAVALRATP